MSRSLRFCIALLLGADCLGGFAPLFAADPDTPVVPDRRVYVPLEELDVLTERDRRGVLLPKAEFQKLVDAAQKNAAKHATPPTTSLVPRCDYSARIVGDQLLITVKAELRQFHPDWQAWSFPLQRLAVERAQLNGGPAFVGRGQNGELTLLTPDPGTHQLELELSTELVTLGSDQAAAFSLLGSAAGELQITLPAGKRLLVDGLQWERPAALDQPAEYRIAVGGRPQVQLRVTDRSTEKTADALLFATTGYGLHVAPGEVTWHALTTLQVFGRQLDRVVLSVPGYLEIADVESTGLDGWELADDPTNPQRTLITLTFGQPFDGQRKIALRGVMPVAAEEPWFAPPLVVSQATSHIGQIVVQHPAGVRLQIVETDGVRRATAQQKPISDMPDDMTKLAAVDSLRFDAFREDFTLKLVTQPKQRELHAAVAAVLDAAATGIELQAALTLNTKFAPLFDVDLTLPVDWTVSAVSTPDGKPLRWELLPEAADRHVVRILLPAPVPAGGATVVQLELRRELEGWPVEKEPLEFGFPEITLPQANLTETAVVIRGDDDLELSAEDVVGLDPVPLKADFERLRFQSQDTTYSGRLRVTRKPARIAAEQIGFYRVDPQTMHAALFAQVTIQGGGARELLVSLPTDVGDTVRFQARGAFLVEQQPLGAENGSRRWRLKFADRVRGTIVLATELELPRAAEGSLKAPVLQLADAEREHGALVVEAGPEQRLTLTAVDAQGQPLAELDPLDLPGVPYLPKERLVAVYRTVSPGAALTLTEERFDKAAVPTAVCKTLKVLTIVARTGEVQQRADFQLQLAGVQQLRVRLPDESDLWAALLNGQPVEVRRADGLFLIPIQGSGAGVVDAALQLFYRRQTDPLSGSGTWRQAAPELTVLSGQGAGLPVEVLEQQWDLVHPDDTLIIDAQGPLEPLSALDTPGWMSQARNWLHTPSWRDVGAVTLVVAIVCGALAVIVLMHRRRGGRGLTEAGAALCALLFLAFVMSLFLPAVQSSRRAARTNADFYAQNKGATVESAPDRYGYYDNAPVAAATPAAPPMSAPAPAPANVEEFGLTREKSQGVALDAVKGEREVRSLISDAKDAESKHLSESLELSKEKLGELDSPTNWAAPRMAQDRDSSRRRALGRLSGEAAPQAADEFDQRGGDLQAVQQLADPLAAPQEPQGPVAGRPMLAGIVPGKPLSGLLSLALNLEKPAHTREKSFRYVGTGQDDGGTPLAVRYVDRRSGAATRWFWLMLGALAGWFTRWLACAKKLVVVVVGLAVTWGLLPVTPVELHVLWDGLFGALCGAVALWLIHGCTQVCSRCCAWCKWPRAASLLLPALLLFGSDAIAQEKAVAPPNPPAAPPRPAVFVPYDAAEAPLAAERVWLPYDKFVELYRLAHPESPVRSPSPVPGGIVEALYSAELTGEDNAAGTASIQVTARLTIRSYTDGQWTVVLPVRGVALSEAQLNGKSAAIQSVENGGLQLVLPQAGLHVLDLKFAVPAKLTGAAGSFGLALGATPAAKLSFALPQPKDNVRVNGSTSAYRRVTKDNRTWIELPVDRGGDVQLSWQPEQSQGAGGAAAIHVESVTAVTLGDAGVTVSAGYKYRVRQGVVRDVSFQLPETLRLQGVIGPDVGGWEVVGDGPQRKLRVFLRRNVGDTTQLTVDGYLSHRVTAEPAAFTVPDIAPQEVTAEAGHLAVYAGEQFALRAEQVQQLQQLNVDNFKPEIPVTRADAAPQLLYRYNRRPWSVALRANRLATQLSANVQQGFWITPRKVQTTNRVVCDLSRVPQSTIDLLVPGSWLILDVQAAGLKDWYLTKTDADATVTIEFDQPRQGQVELVVLATESRDPADAAVPLRTLSVRGAQKHQRQAAVWLDAGLTAQVTSLGGWKSLDSGATAAELQRLRPTPVQLAFQSSIDDPGAIDLTLATATPRLAASSLSSITVTDVATIYGFVWQWQIDQASVDSLAVETPDWLAGRMDFTGAQLREVTHAAAGPGRIRWSIGLRGPVTGKFTVAATATLPPATDKVSAPAVTFFGVAANQTQPLESQRHYVLLVNTSLSQLSATDPTLTEAVQREDVPIVVRQELVNQATEFVRIKTVGTAPEWAMQRYVAAATTPASVNLADLVTVLARDGSYRGTATYTIKNRGRQFLAVQLPPQTKLLSVTVGTQPSRAVLTQLDNVTTHLIALPKTSAADLSFPVQLAYSGKLPRGLPTRQQLAQQELDLPAPRVVTKQESDEFGIPVALTRWTVHLPDDLDVSPLDNPQRHNLNRRTDVDDDTAVRVLLQDYSEVLYACVNPTSVRSQQRAINNLKQLGAAINSYSGQLQKDEKLAGENYRLQTQFAKELSLIVKQQQSVPALGTVMDVDSDGLADAVRLNVKSNDAEQQLSQAFSNNGFIISDNSASGVALDKSLDDNFNFRLPEMPADKPMSGKAAEQLAQQAVISGNGLQARQQYQVLNEDLLSNLNRSLSEKKARFIVPNLGGEAAGMAGAKPDSTSFGVNPIQSFSRDFSGPAGAPQAPPNVRFEHFFSDHDALSPLVTDGSGAAMPGVSSGGAMGGGGFGGGGDDGVNLWADGFARQPGQVDVNAVNNPAAMGDFVALGEANGRGMVALGLAAQQGRGTMTAGLSLPIQLPQAGQTLVFSKAGGDPKLALSLRPRQTVNWLLGGLWALGWLVAVITLLAALRSARGARWLARTLPVAMAALGALGMLLLASPFSLLASVLFVLGAILTAWQNRSPLTVAVK